MPRQHNSMVVLLIGTAVGIPSLAPRNATAACTIAVIGSVNCKADTTTTNTTNSNSTQTTSSDRQQLFDNGAAINGAVQSGVTISGFGLQLTQSSANPVAVTMSNQGSVASAGAANALQLDGNGGLVSYSGDGAVTDTAANGTALYVDNAWGNLSIVTGAGSLRGGTGINATTTGSGTMTIATGTGAVTGTTNSGIIATTSQGAVGVTVGSGGITSNSNEATSFSNDYAINVTSAGGNIAVTANGTVAGSPNCKAFPGCVSGGVYAISNGNGNITIDGPGTYSAPSRGRPILAEQSASGLGSILVTGSGDTVEGTPTFGNSSAIRAQIANPANSSSIVVDRSGNISAYDTFPLDNINSISSDIHALTVGSGNITVTSGASATLSNTGMFGIEASAYGQKSSGSISISTGALGTIYVDGSGIFADNSATSISRAAGSTITVTANGTINSGAILNPVGGNAGEGGGSVAVPAGILAGYNGGPVFGPGSGPYTSCGPMGCTTLTPNPNVNGTVAVVNNAVINAAGGDGIFAFNFGNGDVSVTSTAPITVTGATSQNGIEAFSAEVGNITVNTTANVSTVNGNGIHTNSAGQGTTTINVMAGVVQGGTAGVSAAASGPIQINNFGVIQNVSGLAGDLAIATSGAGNALLTNNSGSIVTGTVAMTGTGTDNFVNGGIWYTLDTSTFAGTSRINNSGTINVFGPTTFSGLATLTNAGTLNLAADNALGTLAIPGNLAFQSGALYVAALSHATSSLINVGGTASLAGTVQAVLLPGAYSKQTYTILHSAGLGGTTFSGFTPPAGFGGTLSYTPTDVRLSLSATLGSGAGLNTNQQNVATAINNFFNSGGALPAGLVPIFALSGGSLANALSQLDGEATADGERAAFQLMTEFLTLMLDPSGDGRSDGGGTAAGFGPEQQASFQTETALPYAGVLKAPPKPPAFDQRWAAWASGFGGSSTITGDPVAGTHTVTTRTYGFAAGLHYHFTPDTVAGFAMAGSGSNWGLAQDVGGGRSDAFQAGVYGTTHMGPAYIAAALAFANHWMTTNRIAFGGDQLTASFNGQSYAGRVEAGYRFAALPTTGITPYAALQAQSFHAPNYSETDLTSGGFGLSYNALAGTDTRSELGARIGGITVLGAVPVMLRARAAWAHDWVSDPTLGAVFQALPDASFIVNGAMPPKNSALTSASAELHLEKNWSLTTKFDAELANGSQTCAGTVTLRYYW